MLVRAQDGCALAIGQLSHSWLSGQLARAWGNDRFPPPQPREDVILGAEQHDTGWALFDLEPKLNSETGLPRGFLELSAEEHLAIWRGAPDRLVSQSLHAAHVVSMHGSSLSELRSKAAPDQAPLLQAHIDEEHERQQRIREVIGLSSEQADRTRRQMWTWDGLSLALCLGWRPFTASDVPTRDGVVDMQLTDLGDGAATLEPWPMADERVELRCEARRLPSRYEDEEELRGAFARAQPIALSFTLAASG